MQEELVASQEPQAQQTASLQHRLGVSLALAEELERRALGQKLHEDLCQILAVANFKLTSLQQRELSLETMRELQAVEDLLGCASRSARSLAFQLSPPVLHTVGLVPALEWLGEEMERLHGLKVRVYDDGAPKPLGALARMTLFRGARELLINVARHAQADVAELSSFRFGERLTLAVSDDGCGFDCSSTSAPALDAGQYGLLWLRERIALIGAEMNVDSRAGGGTHVALRVRLADAAGIDVR
jgi:signal transduction histidine kinase